MTLAPLLGVAAALGAYLLFTRKPSAQKTTMTAVLGAEYQKAVFDMSQPTPVGTTYNQAVQLATKLSAMGYNAQARNLLTLATRKRAASGGKW